MRVHNKAIGMVLAAVLIDTIGFGIVIPVFPALLTGLGHTDIEHATRLAGYMLVVYAGAQRARAGLCLDRDDARARYCHTPGAHA